MKPVIITLLLSITSILSQSDFGYRPVARGGHFISNGRYQNQRESPQQPQNLNNNYNQQPYYPNNNYNQRTAQQQPSTLTNNVIGNTADNIYGRGSVNSIVSSRFQDSQAVNSILNPSAGSSNNVIGNKASNIYGGTANSVLNNPYFGIPGLESAYATPLGAQLTNAALQNAFGNFGGYNGPSYNQG